MARDSDIEEGCMKLKELQLEQFWPKFKENEWDDPKDWENMKTHHMRAMGFKQGHIVTFEGKFIKKLDPLKYQHVQVVEEEKIDYDRQERLKSNTVFSVLFCATQENRTEFWFDVPT